MAQRQYRVDLLNADFPLLSEQQGRTVIGSTKEEIATKDNKPTVQYCHNVMPSSYGLDSIGYTSVVNAFVGAVAFEDVRAIYGDERSRIYLAWDTEGAAYSLKPGDTTWLALPATVPATGGPGFSIESVTVGTVNGISYIFYAGIALFTYDEATDTLVEAVTTGLAVVNMLGVAASSGYLIAYAKDSLAWSGLVNPVDFTPSQITGAGGGKVAEIGGAIIFVLPTTTGIIIYTETNAVSGDYTGNSLYPFKFREVSSSKGGISLDFVAYESNASAQFVYSKAGLQLVTSQKADAILPEVTDFLAGKRFEDFDELTSLLTTINVGSMRKKIKLIASRYLIISYGVASFTHALVYDVSLKRFGKLKLAHVDCFEYVGNQVEVSKESIAFLLVSGEVKVLDFSVDGATDGVLILGKLQYTRGQLITLLGTELENVAVGATVELFSRASLDGKNTTDVQGTQVYVDENIRKFVFRNTAVNHALVIHGNFNAVSVVLTYILAGRR
jgi:hypothetical protein